MSRGEADEAEPPDIDDALQELEELEELVDSEAEREQVRETMRTLREAKDPRLFGRIRSAFDIRDAGEALVGSLVFGVPMLVEDGTRDVGTYIAANPPYFVLTLAIGLVVTVGILHAVRFEEVESDLILGIVPRRLVGILAIAGITAAVLMTAWGRVDWADPWVATCQTSVTGVVMAIGAALGDILPHE
ncbi:DUF2391 family protein [Halostella sp. JP-L12]|uniref:DUF2391 family protein n=1 Tax=Halostella TaxID=1843185 RepID=UPI000EF83F69|nr:MULTISPECIES: DUF2391 family protein [Halostella]NHN49712.1 DUF2391 family protein [Halostella sp. JP-L12]